MKTISSKRPNLASSTQRGYGVRHKRMRRLLLAQLVDGTPCPWCNKPLYKQPEKNFDGAPLEADHEKDIKTYGTKHFANRLLHRRCNRQRGAGFDERSPLKQSGKPLDSHVGRSSGDAEQCDEGKTPVFEW